MKSQSEQKKIHAIILLVIFSLITIMLTAIFCTQYYNKKVNSFEYLSKEYPIRQQLLLKIFRDAYSEYAQQKGNEALLGELIIKRNSKLCQFFKANKNSLKWHGKVDRISRDYYGDVTMSVKVYFDDEADNFITFESPSIKKESPTYQEILKLAENDLVLFSGITYKFNVSEEQKRFKSAIDGLMTMRNIPIPVSYDCDEFDFGFTNKLNAAVIKLTFSEIKKIINK